MFKTLNAKSCGVAGLGLRVRRVRSLNLKPKYRCVMVYRMEDLEEEVPLRFGRP